VLFLLCLLPLATPFLCPYAGPTYSIVSTIVHFDGTPSYPSTIAVIVATFLVKDLREINFCLRLHVVYNDKAKTLTIDQS